MHATAGSTGGTSHAGVGAVELATAAREHGQPE
jgi:hypothetical protein